LRPPCFHQFFCTPVQIDDKDLIYEGIATLQRRGASTRGRYDDKDLIYEGIATFLAPGADPSRGCSDDKDLIYEGIATRLALHQFDHRIRQWTTKT